jgi:hypothetical protein
MIADWNTYLHYKLDERQRLPGDTFHLASHVFEPIVNELLISPRYEVRKRPDDGTKKWQKDLPLHRIREAIIGRYDASKLRIGTTYLDIGCRGEQSTLESVLIMDSTRMEDLDVQLPSPATAKSNAIASLVLLHSNRTISAFYGETTDKAIVVSWGPKGYAGNQIPVDIGGFMEPLRRSIEFGKYRQTPEMHRLPQLLMLALEAMVVIPVRS